VALYTIFHESHAMSFASYVFTNFAAIAVALGVVVNKRRRQNVFRQGYVTAKMNIVQRLKKA